MDEPLRLGFAGRLDGLDDKFSKRLDIMLNLVKLLDEKEIDFYMEFAGDGSVRKRMEAIIKEWGLENKVSFLGNIERVMIPEFWKRQDICISTSDFEGRSISVLEAMGNGAVPIVTQVSGTKEDIIDGINGYLVPLRDYQLIAERIEYLMKNRELLVQMGQRAHDEIYPKSLVKLHLQFWIQEILKDELHETLKG